MRKVLALIPLGVFCFAGYAIAFRAIPLEALLPPSTRSDSFWAMA